MNQYMLSIMKGYRNNFLARVIIFLLLPFSLIYRLGVFCHRNYCRLKGVYKASKPVVSIGNITVGGSGKTPLIVWLARHLQDKGFKPIILTRGYMPDGSKGSDEADMLNEQVPDVPVLAGADRAANIMKSQNVLPADLYICDDAFQHWPLYRDINIVTIDAGNPFGNGHLLPAGILREPLGSLKRADVFILTKTDGGDDVQALGAKLKSINPKALMVESRYKSMRAAGAFDNDILPEDFLKNKILVGFCAIGDPHSFELSLKDTGAKIIKLFNYMDHHVYKPEDINEMVAFCRSQNVAVMITTHKDVVKLRAFKTLFGSIRLLYLPIQLEIEKGSDEFFQKIFSICPH